MKLPGPRRLMIASCGFALLALALIVWPLLDPRPIPVIVAMSVGQVIGTMSFVVFLFVVATDVRSRYVAVSGRTRDPTREAAEPKS